MAGPHWDQPWGKDSGEKIEMEKAEGKDQRGEVGTTTHAYQTAWEKLWFHEKLYSSNFDNFLCESSSYLKLICFKIILMSQFFFEKSWWVKEKLLVSSW